MVAAHSGNSSFGKTVLPKNPGHLRNGLREWEKKLDAFLSFNEMDLLNHAGKVSAQVAEALVLERFSEYNRKQIQEERNCADAEDVALLEDLQARIAKEHEKIQKL
jgi:hypothetical protein